MFNEICINEEMLPKYTHTHTHTHIYIYIYIYTRHRDQHSSTSHKGTQRNKWWTTWWVSVLYCYVGHDVKDGLVHSKYVE